MKPTESQSNAKTSRELKRKLVFNISYSKWTFNHEKPDRKNPAGLSEKILLTDEKSVVS